MTDRLERCRALLPRLGVDGVLVSDPEDVRYLSGFRGDDATLVVGAEAASICTDARYWEQVHEEVADLELSKVTEQPLLAHSVAEAARLLGAGARLGYQGAQLSHASYRRLRRLTRVACATSGSRSRSCARSRTRRRSPSCGAPPR